MTDPFAAALAFIWGKGRDGDPFHISAADPNPTSYGVTFSTWKAWQLAHNQPAMMNDFKALPRDAFAPLYRAWYWNACRCEELYPPVALLMFDTAVMSGAARAIRLLQEALGVTADGVFGAQTMEAHHLASPGLLVQSLTLARSAYYASLAGAACFDRGWDKRAQDGRSVALAMLAGAAAQAVA